MRTLLVLCAGSRKINHIPVFMNRHPDGKLLAEKAIEGIYSESYQRIIYVITGEIDREYNAREYLLSEIDRDIEVVCIAEETNGPADTVFLAIKAANIVGEFAVRDCLNSIEIETNVYGNFVSGLDLTKYNKDVYKVRTKSFIVINEQNQILDIIEKRFRSDVISVGLYGFRNVDDYVLAYEKLKDPSYPIKKLYLSNVISYLIGYKQRVFHCAPVLKHEDWGREETWNALQRKYAICILDVDKMVGTVFSGEKTDVLMKILSTADNSHVQYVLMTAGKVDSEMLINEMKKCSINCVGILTGISQTNKKMIISTADDLRMVTLGI